MRKFDVKGFKGKPYFPCGGCKGNAPAKMRIREQIYTVRYEYAILPHHNTRVDF